MLNSMNECHLSNRIGWLRASVLGANDGIVSTASLIVGVAASNAGEHEILVPGIASLVAGAMSMAAGEYVSVSSQYDTEQSDLAKERRELASNPDFELDELAKIYKDRGVEEELAKAVAKQLTDHDALGAHARDELGTHDKNIARPVQAALTSAFSFAIGSSLPLLVTATGSSHFLIYDVFASSILLLAFLGAFAAYAGGANIWKGAMRVVFWGILAMGVTAGIGSIVGTVV